MKNLTNINYAINNNATVGLLKMVSEAKESNDYKRGCGLVYCVAPIVSRWDTQDGFNIVKGSDYQCQYDYACGYVD